MNLKRGSERKRHVVVPCLLFVFLLSQSDGDVRLRWTHPRPGSFFRADENVEVKLEATAHPQKHISVGIILDGETIGIFDMPADSSLVSREEAGRGGGSEHGRTMTLTLGAVSIGFHEITAAIASTTGMCESGGGAACLREAVSTNTFEVGEGEIALIVHGDGGSSDRPGTQVVVLDKWGCMLVGGIVTGGGVSEQLPLYLYLNGVRHKTTEGWINTPWLPGPLQLRGAFTDDWGDILVENTTTVNMVAPPTLFGRPSEAELALRSERLAAARSIPTKDPRDFRPLISCLHPTRGRPQDALATRASWISMASQPMDVEWVFAVDSDDEESISTLTYECEQLSEPARVVVVPLAALFHGEGTCVGAWNLAALGASGVVLLSVADDFHPPVAWDDKVLSRTPLDVPAVLMINDRLSSCRSMVSDDTDDDMDQAKQEHGIGKEGAWWTDKVRRDVTPHAYGVLQSHPVLNRERYQQVGYVLYPEYESVYCDDDFTMWASKDDVEVDGFDIEFDHRHSVNGKQVQDRDPAAMHPTTLRNNLGERYLRGLQTFKRRLSASYLQLRGISRVVPRRFQDGAEWSIECKTSVSLLMTFSSTSPPPAHAVLAHAVDTLRNSETRQSKDCVELLAIRSHARNSTLAALAKNRLLDAARGNFVRWIGPWELDGSGSELASRILEGVEAETLAFEFAKSKARRHGTGASHAGQAESGRQSLSVLDAALEYAKTKHSCRWNTLGLVLRHTAALVRFRPTQDSDDDHLWRLCILLEIENDVHRESETGARDAASLTDLVWRHTEPDWTHQQTHDDQQEPVSTMGGRSANGGRADDSERCGSFSQASAPEHGIANGWDVGPTQVELERTRRYLQVTSSVGSVALQCEDCAWVDILEPKHGADVVFSGYSSKSWRVVAAVHGLTISQEGAMACVYLDGDYKGCEAGAGMRSRAEMSTIEGFTAGGEDGGWFEMVFDDPGLDGSWHRLEVRLLDAQDELIGVTATAEFRARLEACSAPITKRIQSGLALEGVGALECRSRLEDGPFPLAHVEMDETDVRDTATSRYITVRETGWADTNTLAIVMSIPNYRRWVVEGHTAAGSEVITPSSYVKLGNSWIVYPGHVVTAYPSDSPSFVMYNLQGACDDRNMAPPSLAKSQALGHGMTGAIVVSQLWGDNFYHWMIECLPRLAAMPRSIVDDPAIAVIVSSDNEFTLATLRLVGVASNRVRRLDHVTVYAAGAVYLPDCGVCGIGPSTMTLRRVSTWLRQGLSLDTGSGQASTCLLVQRTHGARSLLNHDALLLALRASQLPCTWNVLEPVSDNAPGRMEVAASGFASSKVIVSPHGGSLSNLLFSSSYTTLLELLPQFRPNLCYERLCRALGIRYVGLITPESSMNKPWSVHIPSVIKTMRSIVKSEIPSPQTENVNKQD